MAPDAKQGTSKDLYDSIVEALMRELIEDSSSSPKTAKKTISAALTEELMTSLAPSERKASQTSSFEIALLAEALAPALAEELAPALAEALTPALIKALNELVSPQKPDQETGRKEGSSKK